MGSMELKVAETRLRCHTATGTAIPGFGHQGTNAIIPYLRELVYRKPMAFCGWTQVGLVAASKRRSEGYPSSVKVVTRDQASCACLIRSFGWHSLATQWQIVEPAHLPDVADARGEGDDALHSAIALGLHVIRPMKIQKSILQRHFGAPSCALGGAGMNSAPNQTTAQAAPPQGHGAGSHRAERAKPHSGLLQARRALLFQPDSFSFGQLR